MNKIIIIALLAFVGCSTAKKQNTVAPVNAVATKAAAAPAKAAEGVLTCKNGADVRTLEVVKKAEGCELNYTKAGKTNGVASSANGSKHCEDSKAKIQDHLVKAGYSCS